MNGKPPRAVKVSTGALRVVPAANTDASGGGRIDNVVLCKPRTVLNNVKGDVCGAASLTKIVIVCKPKAAVAVAARAVNTHPLPGPPPQAGEGEVRVNTSAAPNNAARPASAANA